MKNILAASTILVLLAGAASAADNMSRERPDMLGTATASLQKTQVKASSIYSPKELARVGLMSNDTVDVSIFPTSGMMEMSGRDN